MRTDVESYEQGGEPSHCPFCGRLLHGWQDDVWITGQGCEHVVASFDGSSDGWEVSPISGNDNEIGRNQLEGLLSQCDPELDLHELPDRAWSRADTAAAFGSRAVWLLGGNEPIAEQIRNLDQGLHLLDLLQQSDPELTELLRTNFYSSSHDPFLSFEGWDFISADPRRAREIIRQHVVGVVAGVRQLAAARN